MEDNSKLIEPLLGRAADYGKTSYELIKLKALDKTSDVVSTLVPIMLVSLLAAMLLLFVSIGLGFMIGDLLGKTWYGFFIVGAFYGILALILQLFFRGSIKSCLADYIIKMALK